MVEMCVKNGLDRHNIFFGVQMGFLDPTEIQGPPLCIKPECRGLGNSVFAFGYFGSDAIEIDSHALELRCSGCTFPDRPDRRMGLCLSRVVAGRLCC